MTDLLDALNRNNRLLQEIALQYGAGTGEGGAAADPPVLNTPEAVANQCMDMGGLLQEQLRVLLLNTKSELLEAVTVYQGTVNAASIRVAEILRPAIVRGAPYFIVVHNHPSGDPCPSGSDTRVTRKVRKAAEYHDIELYDHVVVARRGFVSLRQRGIGWED